jgi:hypothetical protein
MRLATGSRPSFAGATAENGGALCSSEGGGAHRALFLSGGSCESLAPCVHQIVLEGEGEESEVIAAEAMPALGDVFSHVRATGVAADARHACPAWPHLPHVTTSTDAVRMAQRLGACCYHCRCMLPHRCLGTYNTSSPSSSYVFIQSILSLQSWKQAINNRVPALGVVVSRQRQLTVQVHP